MSKKNQVFRHHDKDYFIDYDLVIIEDENHRISIYELLLPDGKSKQWIARCLFPPLSPTLADSIAVVATWLGSLEFSEARPRSTKQESRDRNATVSGD